MTEQSQPTTPEELRAETERTRQALGQTAEELAGKFDVQARAEDTVRQASAQAKQAATQAAGLVQQKWAELPEPVRERGRDAAALVRRRPGPALGVLAALLVVLLGGRRARRARRTPVAA